MTQVRRALQNRLPDMGANPFFRQQYFSLDIHTGIPYWLEKLSAAVTRFDPSMSLLSLEFHYQIVNPIQSRNKIIVWETEADTHEPVHTEVITGNDEHTLLFTQPLDKIG